MSENYNAKDILVLEGLDAVRLRPGMYIGTTGSKGMHHLLWEIVDNSIDELSNGYGNKITVILKKDGSVSVEDDGRGIPVDIHPIKKVSGLELVFTKLHAGGKFNTDNYNFSGGLHGVGASVANALSEWLTVTVNKDKKKYQMKFASISKDGKILSGAVISPLTVIGTSVKRGTIVEFKPDKKVFLKEEFSFDIIGKRLKELAFLNGGVEVELIDERVVDSKGRYLKVNYCFNGGIKDFCTYLNDEKEVSYEPPVYVEATSKIVEFSLALQHTDSYTESIFSYANNIPTSEGGMHEVGFKSALTKVMNDLARKNNLLKEKESNLLGEDFREGLTAVLSIKMNNVQFEGQTKTKLGNPEARVEIESLVYEKLYDFFTRKENLKIFDIIIKKAKQAASVREAARKAKEITRQKNSIESSNLVGKLSACSGRKAELNELFIVEGDSAGGTAKQARERSFQAILPLKGKPLNAEKKRLSQVLQNEEIRTIISALGTGIGDDFDISSLNYHKVIILADADQDGAHIRAILLTFLFRYMKQLIMEGNVYIGMPPLYKVYKREQEIYVYSDKELADAIDKIGRGYMIQRYKGLGEMNAEQLWETTMDPKHRSLMQVTIEDAAYSEKIVATLMGDDIEARKAYIFENANFNKEDNFEKFNG